MARISLDYSAGGSMHMQKTIGEARELIETVATNQHLYSSLETSIKGETQVVLLTEECSAIIQNNLLEKLKDPGSFMIPCTLGDACTRTTLCDLRASINLIPASLIKKLSLTDEVKPTLMCLQLVDGSIKIPSGVVEDMIVRVGPFVFPNDFVVLDMEGHKSASLILGRPFLVTGRTLMDVEKGEVTLRVNEEKFVLTAVKAMHHPDIPEEFMSIDLIDSLVEEVNMAESLKEGLDDILDEILSLIQRNL
ncbi:uncharacterized protein LOC107489175 [Arachis duranensis]|uniref:Uncharacterized protein LOC107489175 n=1 Tax=Arachis duranensis TaxID=130453 RepID=A0A6P4DDX3_ARADU|nr:uncharacterized protein LOC107489175 [Arachis duranensis]